MNFLSYVTLWWFVRSNKFRNLFLTGAHWGFDWFLDFLNDLALSLLTIWWVSKIFSDRFLDSRTWRSSQLLSDGLLNAAFTWIMFKSIITIIIDRLLDFLLNVLRMVHFFIIYFFHISLAKIGRFCDIFIEKLFQFILSFSYFSFSLNRFGLEIFLVCISERYTLFRFGPFFHNGWKYGIVIIEGKFNIIVRPLLFESKVLLDWFVSGFNMGSFIEGDKSVINFLCFLKIRTEVFYGF